MLVQLKNYHMANEVLYVLDSASDYGSGIVSKLSLQKLLYLAGALSPIKDVLLTFLKFSYQLRGPYSIDIQNTIDHLVALGLVDIDSLTKTNNGKYAYVNYKITEGGKKAVRMLREYPYEDEKCWWISVVSQLSYIYMQADGLKGDIDNRIMSIVYQDPSFKILKVNAKHGHLIDLKNEQGITNQLISFIKEYVDKNNLSLSENSNRRNAEILLLTFFEYLYVNYLNE